MDLGIDGDAAIVTASSRGLGRASAAALAAESCDVVVNGRDADAVEATATELDDAHPGAVVAQPGDITEPDAIDALVDRALDEFGGIDHLVTSAGGPPSGPFLDTTDEDWEEAFELLVMSVVRLVREAAPHLEDGGGTVVTITSRTVKEALDDLVLSNSVRMGVIGLEKTLSRELAPAVRCNAVLPGPHETSRIEELVESAVDRGDYGSYEEGLADWAEGVPLERIGEPGELGDVVAWLSSERSSYVNGVAVPVDGGAGRSNL